MLERAAIHIIRRERGEACTIITIDIDVGRSVGRSGDGNARAHHTCIPMRYRDVVCVCVSSAKKKEEEEEVMEEEEEAPQPHTLARVATNNNNNA